MSQPRARRRSDPSQYAPGVLPDDLYSYVSEPSKIGRPVKEDLTGWTVTDDWPERIPVTEAGLDVFEAWFGDLFDELFGPYP
jgi:hypothetical protein